MSEADPAAKPQRPFDRIGGREPIARMVDREEYCVDILQQTAALRAAVDALGLLILEDHIRGCMKDAAEKGDAEKSIEEVLDVVRRSMGRPARSATPKSGASD